MPEKPGAKNSTKLDRCSLEMLQQMPAGVQGHEDKLKQLTVVNRGERWSPVAGPRLPGNDCSWPTCDLSAGPRRVRRRGRSGKDLLALSLTGCAPEQT
jgi:hypothetical protein